MTLPEYSRERKQALSHLLVVFTMAVIMFVLMAATDHQYGIKLLLLKFLFGGLSLFSLLYYLFITRYPHVLLSFRKLLLIMVDIVALTLSITIIGKLGLFLLPFYILIVMESGVNFGLVFFYFTLFFSSLSWVYLIEYSSYWAIHSDTVGIFAITTFLIPLVYLKKMLALHEQQEKLHQTLQHTDYEAKYDTLTGLPNRKSYDIFMHQCLNEKQFFALLFIDLNKFKMINDTYGHDVGDEVLIEASKRLGKHLESEDMLARLGGDEFVIITKRKKIFLPKFIERLEKTTIGTHSVNEVTVRIELSIGISVYPDDSNSENLLRKYADEAMYCAKKRTDTYHVFYDEIKSSENFS